MKILAYLLLIFTVAVFGLVFYGKFTDSGFIMAFFSGLMAAGVPALFTFVCFQMAAPSEEEETKES